MSMCLYLKSGDQSDLTRLAKTPDRLMASMSTRAPFAVMGGLDPEAVARMRRQIDIDARRSGLIGGFLLRMTMGRVLKDLDRRLAANDDEPSGDAGAGEILDLHKSWHALHFLFTGTAWEGRAPADALLNGGREVGEDLGYGPARLLDAKETAAFAVFLRTQTVEGLLGKVDLRRMSDLEIYCFEDDGEDAAEDVEADIETYFPQLKDFVVAAADKGEGLLVWMA